MDVTGPNYSSAPYQHMSYSTPTVQQPHVVGGSVQTAMADNSGQVRAVFTPIEQQQLQLQQQQQQQQQQLPSQVSVVSSMQPQARPPPPPPPQQVVVGTVGQGALPTSQQTVVGTVSQPLSRVIQVGDGLVQTSLKTYKLALSDFKTLSLNEFKGKTYAHIWDNVKGAHVSLNSDELKRALGHGRELLASMEVMQLGEQLKAEWAAQ